jgi:hypothetical protein
MFMKTIGMIGGTGWVSTVRALADFALTPYGERCGACRASGETGGGSV